MLQRAEIEELISALQVWANGATAEKVQVGFVGPKGGPYDPYELVHAVESETEDGKAFLEILEHSVRREGLERVTARLKGDLR